MQLAQQIDIMRTREIVSDKYDDILVYVSVIVFMMMTTVFLLLLAL